MSILKVSGLNVIGRDKRLLHDVSFSVASGEFVGLIGPNGAGKTTMLRSIMNFVKHRAKIEFDGCDLHKLNQKEKAKIISYLPQERDVAWPVSAEMVISLARSSLKPVFSSLDPSDYALIESAINKLNIQHLRERPVNELSGGERALVLIARLLAQDTPVVMADEPAAGLDPAYQLTMMQALSELAKSGKAVIASLHDLSLAAQQCTRLILLNNGRIIADGAPKDILTKENLFKVYNIKAEIIEHDGALLVHPYA